MAHRSPDAPPLPKPLETPDVGFVAVAGVYVGAVLVGLALTGGLAVEASVPTIVGSLSTVATAGIVLGAAVASRRVGLPERLGRRFRRQVGLFVPPAGFAAVALASRSIPSLPQATAVGAGFGAVVTCFAAFGVGSMARTRYARAMTTDEPRATFPWLKPDRDRYWIGFGVACLAVVALLAASGVVTRVRAIAWAAYLGVFTVFTGLMHRSSYRDTDAWTAKIPFLPDDQRRRIFGIDWAFDPATDDEMLLELRVHDAGLVAKRALGRRFVPWTAITDVRLDDDELVLERRGWLDLRCDLAVIDEPERARAAIQRAREADESGTP